MRLLGVSPHFSPAIYSIAVLDAILGNRSLRCSNSCIPAVVPPTSALHGWRKCKRIVRNNPCHMVVRPSNCVYGVALRKMGSTYCRVRLRAFSLRALRSVLRTPAPLERPGKSIRGFPVRRGECPLDTRLPPTHPQAPTHPRCDSR